MRQLSLDLQPKSTWRIIPGQMDTWFITLIESTPGGPRIPQSPFQDDMKPSFVTIAFLGVDPINMVDRVRPLSIGLWVPNGLFCWAYTWASNYLLTSKQNSTGPSKWHFCIFFMASEWGRGY